MVTKPTPTDPDALLSLVERVKENYVDPPSSLPKRGKKRDFSGLSFLLLAVVAVTLRTFRDSELEKLLKEDNRLREAMGFQRLPHRTTIGRRLSTLICEAEQQIALLGDQIVKEIKPQADQSESARSTDECTKHWAQPGTRKIVKNVLCLRATQCRHPIQMVKERISRLGPRLQTGAPRPGFPPSGADLCSLATE